MSTPERPEEISDPIASQTPIRSGAAPAAAVALLAKAARKGRLPGFAPRGDSGFIVEADAVPFPFELRGSVVATGESGCEVRFVLVRRRRMPVVFGVVLLLTIWPGVWLTDSLLGTYWSAYSRWSAAMPWLTYAWYLPITVLPLPWMWRSMSRKSAAEGRASAAKQLESIRGVLGPGPG